MAARLLGLLQKLRGDGRIVYYPDVARRNAGHRSKILRDAAGYGADLISPAEEQERRSRQQPADSAPAAVQAEGGEGIVLDGDDGRLAAGEPARPHGNDDRVLLGSDQG
jgi:hypothetical protein